MDTIKRKRGEVPFSDHVWLKRYHDEQKWHDVREDIVEWDMRKYYPDDWENKMWIMKEGSMSVETPWAEYMFLTDSAYQDELPIQLHSR